LKLLREHGSRTKYDYEILGVNSRLDALQAAILRVKLKYLDVWTAGRQRNADRYRQLINERGLSTKMQVPVCPEYATHIYNQFTIRVRERDQLKAHLAQQGIPSEIYYPHPLHLQPAFSGLGYRPGSMPESEAACREVLSLPIYPELSDQQIQSVVKAIADFES
jgi:dTDP-4-amino-4,6-dideoxygalactose transaminase